MIVKKFLLSSVAAVLIVALVPTVVLAHVIVTPSEAGVGQELVFSVSVPNERNTPVSSVKLLIPLGVTNVLSTMQPGWTVTTENTGNVQDPEVAAITWTGSMPVGQRNDFSFSAQVPGRTTDLDWKAYQTYADGTVVRWDQKPAGSDDATGTTGPYSVTRIVNDLTKPATSTAANSSNMYVISLAASILALFVALLAMHKKK